jgi:para-aminobenzoate synthetase component 1
MDAAALTPELARSPRPPSARPQFAAFPGVVEELRPAPDAWAVAQRLSGLPHLLFLDSALRDATLGRYSFVAADPFAWIVARGPRVFISGVEVQKAADPFAVLAEQLARYPSESLPGLPPFQGGAAGLCGYDLCHHLERLPRPRLDEFATPDLAIGLYDCVMAFDGKEKRAWLISTGFPEIDPARRRRRAERRLRELRRRLTGPAPARVARAAPALELDAQWPVPGRPGLFSNFDREKYLATVRRAIEYVYAGDCFQVNIAQRLLQRSTPDPLALYGRLRERNAAPFGGYFDLGDYVLASASPERFLRLAGRDVETRPIKGTRLRGADAADDRQLAEELLHSSKDRAENIMIVDLLRNDLGRVCAYGSVRVAAFCQVESFRYVHHLVSEVRGRLRDDKAAVDLLRAAFPGGSVTGAPKIRAMEIIAELEPNARGPYCGSLVYIGFDGAMDSNLLIRTFTIGRGWTHFPVGGGIVADSSPEREYEETWHKAEGLLRALQ